MPGFLYMLSAAMPRRDPLLIVAATRLARAREIVAAARSD
jgi:hypothetical protein